jgi:hypothetical protein
MVGQLTSAGRKTLARTFRQLAASRADVVVPPTRRRWKSTHIVTKTGKKMAVLSLRTTYLGFGVSGQGRLPDRVKLPSVAEQPVEKDLLGRTISSRLSQE